SLPPQLTGREKLLMLCNPQNPGGTAYRRDELEAQLAFAQEHDLIVCSDEIHCDLILTPGDIKRFRRRHERDGAPR
ncbi:hypothetical protein B8W55_22775, partial [Cronobacter sakazakii]|uniref:aminotransferase class I/II-fold pyridoxal phosphate-dependent enzyme n=1 Tax=Cronobacter sakazakii TaxID=28141 RepID=UPI000D51D53F